MSHTEKALGVASAVVAAVTAVLQCARWVDAYRIATDVDLPVPTAWRLLLARYNLLAVSTHIYRAFEAMKKPTSR